jgi:hypothetical protein
MPRYLISFDDGSMDHISDAELPAVGESARTVVRDAKALPERNPLRKNTHSLFLNS